MQFNAIEWIDSNSIDSAKKEYVEMEDLLLVPLRWMAWESVIEVSMFNIWSVVIAFPI